MCLEVSIVYYILFYFYFFLISVVGILSYFVRYRTFLPSFAAVPQIVFGTFFRDVDVTFYHMLAVWYRNPPKTWALSGSLEFGEIQMVIHSNTACSDAFAFGN